MTLEEAKKNAKKMIEYYYTEVYREEEKFEYERGHISEDDAIDIIQKFLNYIENESIPKEKVRETLKECQNFIDEFENNEKDSIKEYKKLVNDYDMGLKQGVKAEIEMWKKNKMEYVHKRNILMELLGE